MTVQTDTLTKIELKEPALWDVIIYNDDVTPMDFVTELLCQVFQKDTHEAIEIMYSIHNQGSAVAGTYFYEIAEQKGIEAMDAARKSGYPLAIKLNSH